MMRFDVSASYELSDRASSDSRATDLSALSALIDAAFADVEVEPGCNLRDAALADGAEIDIDQSSVCRERHWSEYEAAELESCTAALIHLNARNWRFFLPAFLRASLARLSLPVWETALPGAVLFNLTYAIDNPAWAQKLRSRFRTLNSRQNQAVRAFLEFVLTCPEQEPVRALDAGKALRSWWNLPELARSRVVGNVSRKSIVTVRAATPPRPLAYAGEPRATQPAS